MWLLLDETDEQNDMRLAAHIINVHQGRVGTAAAAASNAAGSSSSTVSTCVHRNSAWCFIMLCSHLCPCQVTKARSWCPKIVPCLSPS
jgi:DNA replicative helicase MCM subunit Mcm2 (Cdc46/Mcm family)